MGSVDNIDTFIRLKTTKPTFCIENGMSLEAVRLLSFKNWPEEVPMYPTLLAKSGFYYTGSGDEVACFSCKGKMRGWKSGDDPDGVHRSQQPSCDLVNGREHRNIPWSPPQDPELVKRFMTKNSGPDVVADSHPAIRLQHEMSRNTDEILFCFETERLKTFVNWPHSAFLKPEMVANAGFRFIGPPDRTQCHFCSGILRNWEPGDIPMEEHRIHFPACPFVCGREVGNVPNQSSAVEQSQTNGTKYPELATYAERLATYGSCWPHSSGQRPEALAEAGFFYQNKSDHVKCFQCGGALRNWEAEDLPFKEHARWFPRCQFLLNVKGDNYVKNIQENPDLMTPMARAASVPERSTTTNSGNSSTAIFPTGVEYRVDPREVKARLDTPAVKTVLGLGYSKGLVKNCLDQRLRTTGDDFPSAESLLEAIFDMEERSTQLIERTDGSSEYETNDRTQSADADGKKGEVNAGEQTPVTNRTNGELDDLVEGDPVSLMEENKSLKDQRTCKVCMDEEVNVVFLPCRHLVCCDSCAPALNKCPVCRSVVRGTVKVFAP